MQGHLIAFEGLDQSGKQTQAELLRDRLKQEDASVRLVSFPDYGTSIGEEIARALAGERDYGRRRHAAAVRRQPLRAQQDDLQRWLRDGWILVCDRYLASSVAYGEAFGLDPHWLIDMQRFLPPPALTIMLDIAPETAVAAQSGRSRPLRARSRAAGPRARQLPSPGGDARTGPPGRRARQGRDRRRRVQRERRHDSRCRKRPHLARRPPPSGRGARVERRAGRAHIVHQHDDRGPRSARRGVSRRRPLRRCAGVLPPARSAWTAVASHARSASDDRQAECRRDRRPG